MEALVLFGIMSLVAISVIVYELFFDKPTSLALPRQDNFRFI